MIFGAELIGPYTLAVVVAMLFGLPIMAHFLRRALRLEIGPIKAELSAAAEAAEVAKETAAETREVTEQVRESVGVANGSGSLQAQLEALYNRQAADDSARKLGQRRQERIEELVLHVKEMLEDHRARLDKFDAWQTAHGAEDRELFQNVYDEMGNLRTHARELQESLEEVVELIGRPDPGMTPRPLIPYLHDVAHDLKSERAARMMLSSTHARVLTEAVELLGRFREEGILTSEPLSLIPEPSDPPTDTKDAP